MKRPIIFCLILAGVLTLCAQQPLYGQKKQPTIEELNAQISKAEDDIKRNEALLKKIKSDQTTTQNELKLIKSRIGSRQQIVASLNTQMSLIDRDIATKNKSVGEMEKQVAQLKKEYGDMIYAAYKNHLLNNSMAFVFAASDFDEATLRINYMRRYNRMRERRVVEIDSISKSLGAEVRDLSKKRDELDRTRRTRDQELKTLRKDETTYESSRKKLSADEKKVANTIKQKEKEKKAAEAQLKKIIAEETKKSSSKKLSAEDARRMAELSGRFDQNKGKFPYPVQGGVIIDRYGTHPHPTQRGLTISNNGVNIAAEKGAQVHSIFEGVVMRVVFIKGLNNCVMVQHGDYFTVYSNLASVSVKANDMVTKNQVLGALPGTGDNNDYYLHFEIWKGTTHLNPEQWFYR